MHGEMYANTAAPSYASAEAITPLGLNASVPPSVELQLSIDAPNRRFEFQKRSQFFSRSP